MKHCGLAHSIVRNIQKHDKEPLAGKEGRSFPRGEVFFLFYLAQGTTGYLRILMKAKIDGGAYEND